MIFRTLLDARKAPRPSASWEEKVIVRVSLSDGRTYFRTYEFDSSWHKCRRCRKARHGAGGRLRTTGWTCDRCGNPYAGFVRQYRTNRGGSWETCSGSRASSGRLH